MDEDFDSLIGVTPEGFFLARAEETNVPVDYPESMLIGRDLDDPDKLVIVFGDGCGYRIAYSIPRSLTRYMIQRLQELDDEGI